MSSRSIMGLIWLAVLVPIFMITCQPGTAPTEYEVLGYALAFALAGGMWSAFMLVITFFFTSSGKGDQS